MKIDTGEFQALGASVAALQADLAKAQDALATVVSGLRDGKADEEAAARRQRFAVLPGVSRPSGQHPRPAGFRVLPGGGGR